MPKWQRWNPESAYSGSRIRVSSATHQPPNVSLLSEKKERSHSSSPGKCLPGRPGCFPKMGRVYKKSPNLLSALTTAEKRGLCTLQKDQNPLVCVCISLSVFCKDQTPCVFHPPKALNPDLCKPVTPRSLAEG